MLKQAGLERETLWQMPTERPLCSKVLETDVLLRTLPLGAPLVGKEGFVEEGTPEGNFGSCVRAVGHTL